MALLIAFGSNNIDVYYSSTHWPAPGDKAVITPLQQEVGGMIGNAASVYAKLGLPVIAFDYLPNGEDTELILDSMKKSKININYVDINDSYELSKCIVITNHGERIIYVISKSSNKTTLTSRQITQLGPDSIFYCNPIDFFHLSNRHLVLESACQIVFDVEYNAIHQIPTPIAFLSQASILFINQSAHEYLMTIEPLYIKHLAPRIIVITRGENGSLLYETNQEHFIDPCPTTVVDTTGAGDTHHAAFLYAYQKKFGLVKAARFASAAASLSITKMGPRSGQHTENEINEFANLHNYNI